MNGKTVLKAIPTDGWFAKFSDGQGGIFTVPLNVWAVVLLETGEKELQGAITDPQIVDEEIELCEDLANFKGYIRSQSEDTECKSQTKRSIEYE